MAENVFELLKDSYPSLIVRLDTNHDLCTFLMGVYAHLHQIAVQSNKEPKDMRCSVSIVMERLLKIEITYVSGGTKFTDIGGKLPIQRNLNLVRFLEVNQSVRDLALNTVYILDKWLEEKPYRKEQGFENIVTYNSTLWRGNSSITTELVMKIQFDEYVHAQMNWEMEPEQPTTDEGRIIVP